MSNLVRTISEIPVYSLVPVGILFVCGALLWAAGRRVMRAGFAAAGALIGGILGAALGAAGDLGVEPWIAGAVGAVASAAVAVLAYRLALAAVLAALLAALAPMGVWTAGHEGLLRFGAGEASQSPLAREGDGAGLAEPAEVGAPASGEVPAVVEDHVGLILGSGQDQTPAEAPAPQTVQGPLGEAGPAGDVVRSTWQKLIEPFGVARQMAREAWDASPAPRKGSYLLAAVFGLALGLVVGAAAPSFTAVIVSALGGSFLVLSTGWIIAAQVGLIGGADGGPEVVRTPTFWASLWLGVALLGLVIQWFLRPRRGPAPTE